MKKTTLYIIIPFYNEEIAFNSFKIWLEELVNKLATIKTEFFNFNFILVDNGSTDNTYELLSTIELPDTSLIKIKKNFGYGSGIKYGINYVLKKSDDSSFLTWLPSDSQYPAEECFRVFNSFNKSRINNNYEIFLSKRIKRKDRLSTQIISKIFNLMNTICDFKLFGKDINALPKILSFKYVKIIMKKNKLSNDFLFDLGIVKNAVRSKKICFTDFLITFVERPYGNSSWNRSSFKKLISFFWQTLKTHIFFR